VGAGEVRVRMMRWQSDARVRVEELNGAFKVLLAVDGVRFEIIVAESVLEWFVSAFDAQTGHKLWSDWVDYYDLPGETELDLAGDLARDVETAIERLLGSRVRAVVQGRHASALEWCTSGSARWRRVEITDLITSPGSEDEP
jgi:hypothetical protein